MLVTTYIAVAIIIGLMVVIAFSRKGTIHSIPMGGRMSTFESPLDPDEVFARLASGVGTFKVEDRDPQTRSILLTTKPTLATWGFFYPIAITHNPGGGATIHIGIQSRLFQYGPLVTKWHKKCARAIEQTINDALIDQQFPTARIVAS